MKKPRKARPKTNQRRAPKPVAVPQRARTPLPSPFRVDAFLRRAKRHAFALARLGKALAKKGFDEFGSLARRITPREIANKFRRLSAGMRTLPLPYSRDEREALALLVLPFLLATSAIVVHQSVRTAQYGMTVPETRNGEVTPAHPGAQHGRPLAHSPRSITREVPPQSTVLKRVAAAPNPEHRTASEPPALLELTPIDSDVKTVATTADSAASASLPVTQANGPEIRDETDIALLKPYEGARPNVEPISPDPLPTFEATELSKPVHTGICAIDQAPRIKPVSQNVGGNSASLSNEAFGLRLAQAAETQVGAFVIYNDAYQNISFPMGDVHYLFGVCTDVVVRAYRALGLDLQVLVHQARSGTGDRSIDHRRTEVLRRFFATRGESLPTTTFPEDYRPGDIVTYHRPQNHGARAHIALVSSVIAPSGRPMIVHNRGWGPQLEDALFVDQMTGHYRYRGPSPTRNAALSPVPARSN